MQFDAINPGPPLDRGWLDAYCAAHQLDLPESLRSQLLDQNGGAPTQDLEITIANEDTEFSAFFGVDMPDSSTELSTNNEMLRGRIPDGMYAFADDAAGNVFLIESGDKAAVWFWNHEREGAEDATASVAPSLEGFLNNLGLGEDQP